MSKKYEIYSVEAEMFNCNQHYPDCIGFQLNWDANLGFGQLSFIYNTKTQKWSYDNECMSKEFCVAVLDKWLEGMMCKSKDEKIKELELEYEEFIKTEDGKKWLEDCKNRNNGQTGDCGDYIYDFYTEVLM